jgi:hypothetical protein
MMRETNLIGRLQLLLELALTSGDASTERLHQQEQRARDQGLSGIEIDAARRGRSFDARLNHLLGVIMHLYRTDPATLDGARDGVGFQGGHSEDLGLLVQVTEEVLQGVVRDNY